jgi:hypothetical protein
VCSANDDPTYFTAPTPTRPRTYVLSGARTVHVEAGTGRGSIALAVLGEMLTEAEGRRDRSMTSDARLLALLEARDRIRAAEAEYADGTVRG